MIQSHGLSRALLLASLVFAAGAGFWNRGFASDTNPADHDQFRAHAQQVLAAAQKRYEAEPTNSVAAWQVGRACFELVTVLKDAKEMEKIINEGITACRQSVALDPKSAAGHYYLAITVGKLADLKRNLAAYTMVKEVEREFHKARELDEQFCYAGPDRCLGELYFKAPGWPLSVGSRSKARKHLERAAELAPDFPENRLAARGGVFEVARQKTAGPRTRSAGKALAGGPHQLRRCGLGGRTGATGSPASTNCARMCGPEVRRRKSISHPRTFPLRSGRASDCLQPRARDRSLVRHLHRPGVSRRTVDRHPPRPARRDSRRADRRPRRAVAAARRGAGRAPALHCHLLAREFCRPTVDGRFS